MRSLHSSSLGRSQKGVIGVVVMLCALLCLIVIGILAVDVAHVAAVAGELQNATDAAALAGACSIDIDDPLAEPDALSVAAQNWADGRPVSNDSRDTNVSVTVTPTSRGSPGFVSVSATMSVHHILAPVLGRYADTLSASSLAGPSGTINMLAGDRAFPLAVSIDALPDGNGDGGACLALNHNRLTDTVTLYVDVQPVKNAAFTSFDQDPTDYDYLRDSLDKALGLATTGTASIPPVKIGDKLYLCDGIVSQHHLCGDQQYAALMSKPYVVLPVIKGYPQKCTEASVVGFVGAKILDATVDWDRRVVKSVRIRLIKNIPKTRSGELPGTGEQENDVALNNLSPGALKLLPRELAPPSDVQVSMAASTAGPVVRKASVHQAAGAGMPPTWSDRDAGRAAETIQRAELETVSPPAAAGILSAQVGLLHNSGFGPAALKRELDRLTVKAIPAQPQPAGSASCMAARPGLGGSPDSRGIPLPSTACRDRPAPGTAITHAPPVIESESLVQTVFKRTDAGTWGAAKPVSITWEMVTFLWLAVGVGLVSRHWRMTACPRTGFKETVSWPEILPVPFDPGYATLIARLARMRAARASRPEGAASTDTSILGRFRPTNNPWAPTRLGRIRAMRYWHFRAGPRISRAQVRKSEPRQDIRRLRMMIDLLPAPSDAVPGNAAAHSVWQ